MSQVTFLVLGTLFMVLMITFIIWFVYLYQKKLIEKNKAYAEIEKLMQTQVLNSAFSIIAGQELERKRIAEELHDNIGGLLATMKIYSDLILDKTEVSDMHRLNTKVNLLAEQLSDEVRKLSHKLDLRTLSGFGFSTAVLQLCEAISESKKLTVISLINVTKPLNENVSLNLYRIIQELFTNTLKHAMASTVRLEVNLIGNDITVIYEDNGRGFDTNNLKRGMGLQNIERRATFINGKVTIDSSRYGSTFIIELSNYE